MTLATGWGRALREGLRRPGLNLAIAATMALGVAAASTFVSLADAVLLRPLPFPAAERLVVLWAEKPGAPDAIRVSSLPDFEDWKARAHDFEAMAADQLWQATVRVGGEPQRIEGAQVTQEFFTVLGVRPALGRLLQPTDFKPAAPPVVVLSHRLWSERFGSDPLILGRSISLGDTSGTVVGVLPPEARLTPPIVFDDAEIFSPLVPSQYFSGRGSRILRVIARVRPSIAPDAAAADLWAVGASLAREHPDTNEGWRASLSPLRELLVGDSRAILLLLLAAGLLVLLVASSNVTNMMLVRISQRQREFAVRLAIGARRSDLIRQLVLESLPVAALAALLALFFILVGWSTFTAILPGGLVQVMQVSLDWQVIWTSVLLSALVLIVTQVAAALALSRAPLLEGLKEDSAGAGETRGSRRTRSAILAGEVALSFMLLIGAALLIHSLLRLTTTNLGFEPERVLVVQLELPGVKYQEPAQAQRLFDRIFHQLDGRPGLVTAGLTNELPLAGGNMSTGVGLVPGPQHGWLIDLRGVSSNYFTALGIPLLRGRAFAPSDGARNRNVVLLNAVAAHRLWPGQDPVGKQVFLDWGESKTPREVVGLVGDVRYQSVEAPPRPEIYLPYQQLPFWAVYLAVRTRIDPLSAARDIRSQIRVADPDLTIVEVTSLPEIVATAVKKPRTYTRILSSFAAVSLLLAAVGVYGVTAFVVSTRRREVGVRIALGAQRSDLVRTLLVESFRPVGLGMVVGLFGAYALSRLLTGLLYGVSSLDPPAYAATAVVLFAVALAAAYLPALRASRLDPCAPSKRSSQANWPEDVRSQPENSYRLIRQEERE